MGEASIARSNKLEVANAVFADQMGRRDLDLWEDHTTAVSWESVFCLSCASLIVVGQEEDLHGGAHNHQTRKHGCTFMTDCTGFGRIGRRVCFKHSSDPLISVEKVETYLQCMKCSRKFCKQWVPRLSDTTDAAIP